MLECSCSSSQLFLPAHNHSETGGTAFATNMRTSGALCLWALCPLIAGQEGLGGLADLLSGAGGGGGGGGLGDMLGNIFSGGGLQGASGGKKEKIKKGSGDGCNFACPKPLKKFHDPNYKLWSNGCGTAGMNVDNGYNFKPCCDRHDACYETCGMDKASCDKLFKGCMSKRCRDEHPGDEKCASNSALYTVGVTLMGCGAYRAGQEQACLCIAPEQLKHERVALLKGWYRAYDKDAASGASKWGEDEAGEKKLTKHVNKLLFDYSKLKGLKTFPRLIMKLSKRWPALVLIMHGEKVDPNQALIDSKRKDGTLLAAPSAHDLARQLGGIMDEDDDDEEEDGPPDLTGNIKQKRLPTPEEVAARKAADEKVAKEAKKAAEKGRKLKAKDEKTRLAAHRARKKKEKAEKAGEVKAEKQLRKATMKDMKEYVKAVPVSSANKEEEAAGGGGGGGAGGGGDGMGDDSDPLDGADEFIQADSLEGSSESELDDLMKELDAKDVEGKPEAACAKHKDCPVTHFCASAELCRECKHCRVHPMSYNGKCPCGPARKKDKKAKKLKKAMAKAAAEKAAADAAAPAVGEAKKDEL